MKRVVFSFLSLALALGTTSTARAQQSASQLDEHRPAKLVIPHKARISGDGVVSLSGDRFNGQADLIFKVFAQQSGGAKLFEERQTVQVKRGVYDIGIGAVTPGGFPEQVFNAHATLWIEVSRALAPNSAAESRVAYMSRPDGQASGAVNPQFSFSVPRDVSLCWTCGGTYPVNSGYITLPAGSTVNERGPGCAEPMAPAVDTAPRLCSRNAF